ncbi:hypothetical protein [Xylanibacter muris]|nr:hypothetical protein [Xylanibacter muris]
MILLVVLGWLSFNIKFLSPVARAIQGFSLSDMYYEIDWQEEGSPEISKEITLIDITELTNRAEIAGVIEDVRKCEPSVIGVDIIFEDQNYDMHGDMVLMDVAESSNAIFAKKTYRLQCEDKLFPKSDQVILCHRPHKGRIR